VTQEGSGELAAPPGFSAIHAAKFDDPSSILSGGWQPTAAATNDTGRKGGKSLGRKEKFVPLMSKEGQSRMTPQLPGRHPCQCLAQRHTLINNCVECGRIVCAQVCVCTCACMCEILNIVSKYMPSVHVYACEIL